WQCGQMVARLYNWLVLFSLVHCLMTCSLFMRRIGMALCLFWLVVLAGCSASAADRRAGAPRIAVISAFQPELTLLRNELRQPQTYSINGVQFTTGLLKDKPVVMFLSGVSMVNAAMTTQL